jgi:DNA mismatch repair protein MutS
MAKQNNYVRPVIDRSRDFDIRDGRHITVENNISSSNFIPNDCNLNKDQRLWLITGPNMAGKSTFLRQNALIAILAQFGSFVPASYAKIGIIDRLFSRIGASDDIARGQSTFMVEMIETANILSQSTENSFIILDEIGRGTSTYDGVSIAWGCLEYIHNDLKCRSLFATHYHELTNLSKTEASLKNYTMDIREDNGKIIFLHKIVAGIADKSYGIHVAELAGIPKKVIRRAYEVLGTLEKDDKANKKNIETIISNNYSFFDREYNKNEDSLLKKKLHNIIPDELSPKEALELLYDLKKTIE